MSGVNESPLISLLQNNPNKRCKEFMHSLQMIWVHKTKLRGRWTDAQDNQNWLSTAGMPTTKCRQHLQRLVQIFWHRQLLSHPLRRAPKHGRRSSSHVLHSSYKSTHANYYSKKTTTMRVNLEKLNTEAWPYWSGRLRWKRTERERCTVHLIWSAVSREKGRKEETDRTAMKALLELHNT